MEVNDGATAREAAAEPRALSPRAIGSLLAVAIGLAWYVGFRLPNRWTATLDAASLTDGFYRRFLVGTLLRPLALATDFSYALFATFSLLVLGGLLAVVVRSALRDTLLSRQLLVVAFFLVPTGPFLFHEVGYFEQVLYLLLFASLWLLRRERVVAATCVMALTPFVHEIAIVTVIPIFGLVALHRLPFRRALLVTAVPAILDVLVLLVPPASDGAVQTLTAALQHASFEVRGDALELFGRSQAQAWEIYKVKWIAQQVIPVAIFVVAAYVCLGLADRRLWRPPARIPAAAGVVASCAAIGVPAVLVFGGWDGNRWIFLLLVNFVVVVWLALGEDRRVELSARGIAVLVTTILVIAQIHLYYFKPDQPRELTYHDARAFLHQWLGRSIFDIPQL